MAHCQQCPRSWTRASRARAGLLAMMSAGLFAPRAAYAQAATPLDRFDPAPAGDALFSVPSAGVSGELRPALAATLTYANQPLLIEGERSGRAIPWVEHQLVLHTLASLDLARRLLVELDLPLTLAQGGESGTLGTTSVVAPSGAAVGDLRAGVRVVLLQQDGLLPAAALRLSAWLPSGDNGAFAGASSARFASALAIGAESSRWIWTATVGGRFQPASSDSLTGSEILGGVGMAIRLGALQIGPELSFTIAADDPPSLVQSRFGAEALIGVRTTLGRIPIGLGGGPGFGQLPGTPAFRMFAFVAFDFGRSLERDGEAEVEAREGAHPAPRPTALARPAAPDLDGDSVPDVEDACPTVVGEAQPGAFAKGARGCPPDRDADGAYDMDDRCPDEPGAFSADLERNGCPVDTDGDGLVDAKDACPKERGRPTEDPSTSGCPISVRVEGTQIVILQQVNFATGKADIQEDSFPLLGEVAAVMAEHPEIARVAVDGHTDNVGAEAKNLGLSQQRALSVVTWLTGHGVDARRLEARGFGPRRPIADNKTPEGRAKNRRVEFQIRRRTAEGAQGWRDGPLD